MVRFNTRMSREFILISCNGYDEMKNNTYFLYISLIKG